MLQSPWESVNSARESGSLPEANIEWPDFSNLYKIYKRDVAKNDNLQ